MQQLQFKTPALCPSCLAELALYLNNVPQVQQWRADSTLPETVLTIEGERLAPQQVIALLEGAGFRIEFIGQ